MNRYATGDDITIQQDLLQTVDGAEVPAELAGAVIASALVLPDRSAMATGSSQVAGTVVDPIMGVVEVTFPAAMTALIPPGIYYVETQTTIAGKPYTFEPDLIEIYQGHVT